METATVERQSGAARRSGTEPQTRTLPICIEHLRVVYKPANRKAAEKIAVNDLSLSVREGEVFGFLGPNGAGKTTTMNVLLGFVQPTSGKAEIYGKSVTDEAARYKRSEERRVGKEWRYRWAQKHENEKRQTD